MSYDLRQIARQAGLSKNRTLRPIEITETLKRDLYRVTVQPVRAWQEQVRERIRPAYGQALSTLTQDDESDDIEDVIRISEALVSGATVQVNARVEEWMTEAVKWHEERWNAVVRAGVGIDVFPFVNQQASAARIKAFQKRIVNLVNDISATARKDIAETVWRGFTNQTPRRKMAKELTKRLGIARRRANLIAVDQSQKLNSELTAIRMEEAGLDKYEWRHSGKVHYRPHHKARDGNIYTQGEPAGDTPGMAVYCGCVRMPVIDVEEE